jgi:type III pantothenate kinase
VDRIVERMIEELGSVRAVIATGGLAGLVLDECRTITAHEPMITLIGLRMVYERNL